MSESHRYVILKRFAGRVHFAVMADELPVVHKFDKPFTSVYRVRAEHRDWDFNRLYQYYLHAIAFGLSPQEIFDPVTVPDRRVQAGSE